VALKLSRHLPLFLVLAVAAAEAHAQELFPPPPKQRGAFLVPMITVSETYDDNLFFTPFPESDLVTRVTAGAELGYRSTPFTLDVLASRAADTFTQHKDLNTTDARTLGQVSLNYLPSRSLTFAAAACYLETRTPSELNTFSGLAVGRSLATRLSVTPMVELRLGAFSSAVGFFTLADDTLDGRDASTRTGGLGVDRRISGRDTVSVRYEHRWFAFSGIPLGPTIRGEKSTADVATFGWARDLNERTVLVLRAGPRSAKGRVNPEILASLKRRIKGGRLSVTYLRSQATTLGTNGALDLESLAALYTRRIGRHLEISSGPGVYRNSLRGLHLMAFHLNAETLWRFTPYVHVGASYSLDMQQPDFGADGYLRRGGFQVRLIVSPPQRQPDPSTDEAPEAPVDERGGSSPQGTGPMTPAGEYR